MKLKKFNPANVRTAPTRRAIIRIGNNNGLISLSGSTVALLALNPDGDKVSFVQDDSKEWYLIKDTEGFDLRSSRGQAMMFNCKGMVAILAKSLSREAKEWKTVKFRVAEQPTVLDEKTGLVGFCVLIGSAEK